MTQLRKLPGSKNCFVCGGENPVGLKLNFFSPEPGQVCVNLWIPSEYQGYPDVVHGGIIAAILDETGGRSQMIDSTRFMVTAQLNIRYRLPIPTETDLLAIGMAGEYRGRVSHAHSQIQNLAGEILAEAELVLVEIPETQLALMNMDELGWRVYPDEEA